MLQLMSLILDGHILCWYIYSFTPQIMLSYTPRICYHHCMRYHQSHPLGIFMLKYGYDSASNLNPIWLRKAHNLFTLVLYIHFPSFISQGIHRIPYQLEFNVVYWFLTTIYEFHHDLFILLQELLYPIIFMIVVALELREIT